MAKGVSLAQEDKTLREWTKIWQVAKKPEIAATTWENYDHALKIVLPKLKSRKPQWLKPFYILHKKGMEQRTGGRSALDRCGRQSP